MDTTWVLLKPSLKWIEDGWGEGGGERTPGDLKQEELLEHFTYIRKNSHTTVVTRDGEILVVAFEILVTTHNVLAFEIEIHAHNNNVVAFEHVTSM